MPAAGQERSIAAIIALALLFITQALGAYMAMGFRFPQPQVVLVSVMFYATGLLGAVILSLLPASLSRPGNKGFFSPVLPLLAILAVLLAAGHGMGREDGFLAFVLRSAGVGGLWIISLHAFFLFVPQRRKGLFLGLTVASGELLWVAFLPAMHIFFANAAGPAQIGHLLQLQMALQFGCLLLLAAVFVFRPAQTGNTQSDAPAADTRSEDSAKPSVLPLLFLAAGLLHIAYGLASGLVFPKLVHISQSGMPHSSNILLLFAMPLMGAIFDRGGRGCRLLFTALAVLAFAAPAMLLTAPEGAAHAALYALLNMGRMCMFLITLLLADRLLRNRKCLPLLLALAFILRPVSAAGQAIARTDAGLVAQVGAAFALALAFTLLAVRLRAALSDLSQWDEADPAAFTPSRRTAFVSTYGLSRQEILVMEMLSEGRSTDDIAAVMNVRTTTVNTYISRMLKKTQSPNRAALIELFASQNPA